MIEGYFEKRKIKIKDSMKKIILINFAYLLS